MRPLLSLHSPAFLPPSLPVMSAYPDLSRDLCDAIAAAGIPELYAAFQRMSIKTTLDLLAVAESFLAGVVKDTHLAQLRDAIRAAAPSDAIIAAGRCPELPDGGAGIPPLRRVVLTARQRYAAAGDRDNSTDGTAGHPGTSPADELKELPPSQIKTVWEAGAPLSAAW